MIEDENIQIKAENDETPSGVIQDLVKFNPRIIAYRTYFVKNRKFAPGHLTRLATVCIDYLLQFDESRTIKGEELVALDSSLAAYFQTESGTFYIPSKESRHAKGCLHDAYRMAKRDYIEAEMRGLERDPTRRKTDPLALDTCTKDKEEKDFVTKLSAPLKKIRVGHRMAKVKDEEFWTDERKRFLLRTVQENPQLFQIQNKKPSHELEQYFNETAQKLGVTSSECFRYYTLMHSKYLRQKKKLSDGKTLKNNWPFLEDFQLIEATHNRTLETPLSQVPNRMEVTPNVFLAKNPNNKQQPVMKMEGAYDNVAFTSGSSEDEEDDYPTQSHSIPTLPVNPRKRPLSPGSSDKRSVFRKAGEYMVAELENMEPEKAELLLNKTLKFFVEHRYD